MIQRPMVRLMRGRTTFVIAHSLSMIRHAHTILVMDRDSIVEMGTHEELLAARGFYYDLYQSQCGAAPRGRLRLAGRPPPCAPWRVASATLATAGVAEWQTQRT